MAKQSILKVGDTLKHEEFGTGIVERAIPSLPGTFDVRFEEGKKYVNETSKNIISINGKSLSAVKRSLVTEEAYQASAYSRYEPTLHDGDFAEVIPLESELVEFLDKFCIDKGYMVFGCNPSYEQDAIAQLTAAGVPELARYLQIGKREGEEAHGFWINIFIPNPGVADIDKRLRMFFNPRRLVGKGVYQLSKLSYNRRLLGKVTMHGAPEDEAAEDLVLDN